MKLKVPGDGDPPRRESPHLCPVELLHPGELHLSILDRLLSESGIRGPLVMDAHLAALAIEHRATLCTTDRDFKRFPGLRLHFPLALSTS